jgi:hypothetical protein
MVLNSIKSPLLYSYDNRGAFSSPTASCVLELFLEVIRFRRNLSTPKWLLCLVCGPF